MTVFESATAFHSNQNENKNDPRVGKKCMFTYPLCYPNIIVDFEKQFKTDILTVVVSDTRMPKTHRFSS